VSIIIILCADDAFAAQLDLLKLSECVVTALTESISFSMASDSSTEVLYGVSCDDLQAYTSLPYSGESCGPHIHMAMNVLHALAFYIQTYIKVRHLDSFVQLTRRVTSCFCRKSRYYRNTAFVYELPYLSFWTCTTEMKKWDNEKSASVPLL
jgi:hypothetical protein